MDVAELEAFKTLVNDCTVNKGCRNKVETCNIKLCQALLEKTSYRKFRVRLHIPDAYPAEELLVELTSDTLPPLAIKRMTKQAEKAAASADESSSQVRVVMELLLTALTENKFLYAFDEIKSIQQLISNDTDACKMTLNEKRGTIVLALEQASYRAKFVLTINDLYPDYGIEVKCTSSNFHENLVYLHVAQAQELSRRCTLGYTPEQALSASNPIPKPTSSSSNAKEPRMTTSYLHNLKGDVKFLKQATDLRAVNSLKAQGTGGYANDTSVRRAARRELKTRSKEEMQKEVEFIAAEKANLEFIESNSSDSSSKSSTPSKSLLALYEFLSARFMKRLVLENCQACHKAVLPPNDPEKACRLIQKKALKRPERVYCGHWYHWGCLDTLMTSPPFGKVCPVCEVTLFHPDWPSDVKKLEKAWANKQTKERELEEIGDCFDLDDEFKVFL